MKLSVVSEPNQYKDMQSNARYLEGIKAGDIVILGEIRRKCFPGIFGMIHANGGNREDAEDIFQDALIVLYEKLQRDRLDLHCSFKTYLYAVCRNLWLKVLQKRRTHERAIGAIPFLREEAANVVTLLEEAEQMAVYREYYNKLGEQCRAVLRLYFEGHSFRHIADTLGLSSEQYAKNIKYKCKKKLIHWIKRDQRFGELSEVHNEG